MRTSSLFWLLFLLPVALLTAESAPDRECEANWTLQINGAYYQPLAKSFTKVYSRHLLDYQVEASKRIRPYCELWTGVQWASKRGHGHRTFHDVSYTLEHRSQVFITPLYLGAKWVYPILPIIDLYAGASACYSFLRIKNVSEQHDSYASFYHKPLKKSTRKEGWGALFILGLRVSTSASTFLNFFIEYYAQRFELSHHHLDCSGLKGGLGLGVYF